VTHLLRLACCFSLVVLIGAGCYAARPAVLEEFGLDFWELPKWQCQLVEEGRRDHGLSERIDAVWHRYGARVRIGRELLAGRLSLAEAVGQTKQLAGLPENYQDHLRRAVSGQTDEERLYRHVIDWTCDFFRDQPEQVEQMRRRLQAELETFLQHAPARI
jgi:hypothetical protein